MRVFRLPGPVTSAETPTMTVVRAPWSVCLLGVSEMVAGCAGYAVVVGAGVGSHPHRGRGIAFLAGTAVLWALLTWSVFVQQRILEAVTATNPLPPNTHEETGVAVALRAARSGAISVCLCAGLGFVTYIAIPAGIIVGTGIAYLFAALQLRRWERAHHQRLFRAPRYRMRSLDGKRGGGGGHLDARDFYVADDPRAGSAVAGARRSLARRAPPEDRRQGET
jgi:hypothetical protein